MADCNKNLQGRRWKIKNFQPLIENAAYAAEYEEIMEKKLIIFTDSGDTLIDEGSQIFDENGIVTSANLIEGADLLLKTLHDEGFTIALVADGEWQSFQNVYRENGLGYCFDAWVVSEVVGKQKPEPIMFETAMQKLGLTQKDRTRIVMIGNNLKKDIVGANRQGFVSVWLDWSPRYFHEIEEPDWQPDYIVKTPMELLQLLHQLEKELNEKGFLKESEKKGQDIKNGTKTEESSKTAKGISHEKVNQKLLRLVEAFCPILYEDDKIFLENMKSRNLAGDDIRKYQHWEWTQGVGLYGLWKLFEKTRETRYEKILTEYYEKQLKIGFPALNVNTVTPFLTMALLGEYLKKEEYLAPCRQAAEWIFRDFPRTEEGGFQHKTSDSINKQELWDDTLFMTVLFLAVMGRIEGRRDYIEEAEYQFLLHAKYLQDPVSGLWYHGWTFLGRHNFAGAFWGRGNCWITIAIPEFLSMADCSPTVKRALTEILQNQVDSLEKYQEENGMWHTLIDDADSYVEASATCGFAYGILRGVHTGLLSDKYLAVAERAVMPIFSYISDDGILEQVSYGTPMGRENREFYKNIELKSMPYGQALAMLFFMEYGR